MSLDQRSETTQPTAEGNAGPSGDVKDGPKTDRSVEPLGQPVRPRGEPEKPDQDDEPKTGRDVTRLD